MQFKNVWNATTNSWEVVIVGWELPVLNPPKIGEIDFDVKVEQFFEDLSIWSQNANSLKALLELLLSKHVHDQQDIRKYNGNTTDDVMLGIADNVLIDIEQPTLNNKELS